MKLSNLQKWGIAGLISCAGGIVVFAFAVAGKIPPAVVYAVFAGVVVVAGVLGFQGVQPPPQPPAETPPTPPA